MKLYERELVRCVLIMEESADDGEGGVILSSSDGAEFKAALIGKNLKYAEIGGRRCFLGEYDVGIPTEYEILLKNGDRFRSEDGTVYTVVGEGKTPPAFSVIRFSLYSADAISEVKA